jgi:hypothetical protein
LTVNIWQNTLPHTNTHTNFHAHTNFHTNTHFHIHPHFHTHKHTGDDRHTNIKYILNTKIILVTVHSFGLLKHKVPEPGIYILKHNKQDAACTIFVTVSALQVSRGYTLIIRSSKNLQFLTPDDERKNRSKHVEH